MEALGKALGARTQGEFDGEWAAAEQELAGLFDEASWGLSGRTKLYTSETVGNLWNNELNETVRSALKQAGVDRERYGEWLREIHYVYVAAYSKQLFDRYQDNEGWRVLILSVPALGVGAVGIASHYQQGQNHNRLAEVSNLLYDHAAAALAKQDVELPGRKVEKADWDGTGLMAAPPTELCGVELPRNQAAKLKYVRTTTVKKILASFIDVQPLDLTAADLGSALEENLRALEKAGGALV